MHHEIIRLQVHRVLKSGQQEERRDPWLAEGSCRLQVGQTTLDYKALLQGKETVGRKSPESGPVMRMKGQGGQERGQGWAAAFHGQREGPNRGKAAVGILFNWPGKQLASLRGFLKR